MRKFSQYVLSVMVAFILCATAIGLPVASAHAQVLECRLASPITLGPGNQCELKDAAAEASIVVIAALAVSDPMDVEQTVKIAGEPNNTGSSCDKTFTLSKTNFREKLDCTPDKDRLEAIFVENVEDAPLPVKITWSVTRR